MTKAELRKKYKALRETLTAEQVKTLSEKIAFRSLNLPIWGKVYYHLFLPIEKQHEIETSFLLTIIAQKGKKAVVPKIKDSSPALAHILLNEHSILKKNRLGIPEPVGGTPVPVSKIEVVFVPLLAFDNVGNRVGYGKGFYDSFLQECGAKTIFVGLSFFEAENSIEDISPHDVPLRYCVTPQRVYDFSTMHSI